jgi:uncharacterized RDD family membrane protein YckC
MDRRDIIDAWIMASDLDLYDALDRVSDIGPGEVAVVREEFARRGLPRDRAEFVEGIRKRLHFEKDGPVLGSLGARLAAACINITVVYCCLAAMQFLNWMFLDGVMSIDRRWILALAMQWIFLLLFLADGAWRRATFGMRRAGLEVSRQDGTVPSYWRAFGRLFVGALLLPLSPISWYLLYFWSRSLADFICGTVIIMRIEPIGSRGFEVILK